MQIPENAIEFNKSFDTEEKCIAFIEKWRWPHGFVCPNCQHDDGYRLHSRPLIQCVLCRHQTSVTAGTLFHRTHLPLTVWFYIIFSVSHDKGGASSTRLAAELGMRQPTVWNILHKLRHAMGRRDEPITLAGFIEMDEAILGPEARRPTISRKEDSQKKKDDDESSDDKRPRNPGRGRPRKIGKNKKTQTEVLVLAEQEPGRAGVVAMKALDSLSARDLREFLQLRVDEGQHIKTDAFPTHHYVLRSFPCSSEVVVCGGPDGCNELPIVHRAISLLKTFLMGTYYGIAKKYLQFYLHEFSFRFNRRDSYRPLWLSLLRSSIFCFPLTYAELSV